MNAPRDRFMFRIPIESLAAWAIERLTPLLRDWRESEDWPCMQIDLMVAFRDILYDLGADGQQVADTLGTRAMEYLAEVDSLMYALPRHPRGEDAPPGAE